MAQVGSTPGAREVASTLLSQWKEHIRGGIATMQETGQVQAEIDADRAAAAFIAGIQGGVQMLRSTGSSEHLEATLDLLIDYLRAGSR
jgi:hypothetical protein